MENGSNINNINREAWDRNPPKNYALSGKIMLGAIVILFAVVVIMVALHVYARWYLLSVRRRYLHRRRQRSATTQIVFYVDPNSSAATASRGLDAQLLNSLPVFAYSARTHPHALECAVCLSEFEEDEMGRKLPKCHHSFHIDCIDMWFHSHSTCPVCRSPVEPENKSILPQNHQIEPVVTLGESSECEPGSSSGLAERRKGLDVRIEVPRRNEFEDESRLSSPASHEYRSPGTRLLSLRRILSMNRRTTAVSPSAGTGGSRGYVGIESDVEMGRTESTRGQTRAQTPR